MPWCPKCKAEYREGFTECAACHVPLVDTLPDETQADPPENAFDAMQAEELTDNTAQLENPIAVFSAPARIDAEMMRDVLRDSGIPAEMRRVLTQHSGAVTGRRARYVVEVMVAAADTARARAVIDETRQALESEQMDEEELARLAEEQAVEMPEQPMEDNTSFKMLPVVAAVIVVALVLLWLVVR